MFKRVLVLVVFLFGVFWWLTHRGGDEVAPNPAETDTTNEAVVETVDPENSAEEAAAETEAEPAEAEEVQEEEASTPQTVIEVAEPAVTTPAPTPAKPVFRAPVVPARVTDVKVFMYEWNVDLSDKNLPAGTINFQVQNDGRFTHDFNVTGFGNLGKIMPGEVRTFTLKLKAGEYEVFSDRRQDKERGVLDVFTVTP